jgi:4-amino-4-deoxy-L-arabinose transferase-like glycosyltransferase
MSQARQFVFIAAGWIAAVAAISYLLVTLDNFALRELLRRWQFWFLEATFALCVVLAAATLPGYVRSLALSRADYLCLAAAAVLAGVLAGTVAPRTNRIFYDEQIYQGIGQNLADAHLAQMCNEGTVEYGTLQCWRGEYNKQPNGYPYLLSLVYRTVGASYWAAAQFNVLCAVLLAASIFFIGAGLFEDRWAARLAALIVALIPQQLLWSHTGAAEPSAALLGSVAVLATVSFVRSRSTAALGWMVAAAVFAVQFRTESLLIVVVIAALLALSASSELRHPRFWAWSLVGLILAAPLIAHLAAVRNEGWGTTGDRLSLDYVVQNIQVNARFYLADSRFPPLYTALALGALAAARHPRALAVCGLYFFLF